MKLCLLSDLHFGIRGNSIDFHNYFERFYTEVFFPYLEENNISTIIQFGDIFDSRRQINLQTLYLSKQYFFNQLKDIDLHIILGNHCSYFKNSLEINSPELLLNEYPNITIHKNFTTISFDGTAIDFVPWICAENEFSILEQIQTSKSTICCGHFELSNFYMDTTNVCVEGMNHKLLSRYEYVFSGHFHTKSNKDNILYLGTPVELTWSDYNDPKGFHVFDTASRTLTFIQNPYKMFRKLIYDDTIQDFTFYESFDFSQFKNSYVKVVVVNKANPYLFDKVLESLNKESPLDVVVIENLSEYIDTENTVDESKNTLELLHEFIDHQELLVDSGKMKNFMQEIYLEALNLEKTA